MDAHAQLLLDHGVGFEVTRGLDSAICEAALELSSDRGRQDVLVAIERGRFTDGRRRLLILPPDRNVLLGFQDAALTVADGRGAVGRLANDLADRIAKIVGYASAPRRFKVIMADSPWKYNDFGGEGHGAARDHYDTMSIDDLKNLRVDLGWGPRRVKDLADPRGCALVMWIPAPKAELGFEVMRAWGFEPVTKAFLWVKKTKHGKPHFGQGVYTRQSDEDAWLGKIGRIAPKRRDVRREVVAPVGKHSAKPHEIYERIESLWDGPYLELFSRSRRSGWCSWGNDLAVRQRGRVTCPR
jgi:N6-adenosine-specific RNA methylase IME4